MSKPTRTEYVVQERPAGKSVAGRDVALYRDRSQAMLVYERLETYSELRVVKRVIFESVVSDE